MRALGKLILFPLCFLYVLTPGSKRLGDNGSHYFDALFLGVMNALGITAIFYYFFDYSSASYLHAVGSMGSWVGGWTFLGGIYYPILADMLEKEKEDKLHNRQAATSPAKNKAAQKYEEAMAKSKREYWGLLTKNGMVWRGEADKALVTESGRACYELVLKARILQLEGRSDEAEALWMRDPSWVESESERFEIDKYNLEVLKMKSRSIGPTVGAARARLREKEAGSQRASD